MMSPAKGVDEILGAALAFECRGVCLPIHSSAHFLFHFLPKLFFHRARSTNGTLIIAIFNQLIYIKLNSSQLMNASELLPLKFGNSLEIKHLSWANFVGEVDHKMPWSAHIYWSIDYKIVDLEKGKLQVNLQIGKKSWVREEKKCHHLLNHEQGHYLIGSLCALEFMRRVDSKRKSCIEKFEDMVIQTFERTIKEYLDLQKQYDFETDHRLNYKVQEEWDKFICQKLQFYVQIYDKKKHRFVKLSESPTKER